MSLRTWAADAGIAAVLTALAASPSAFSTENLFVMQDAAFTLVAITTIQDRILGIEGTQLGWPLSPFPQADWMLGQALVGLPLRAFEMNPLVGYKILCLTGLWLTTLVAMRIGEALLGRGPWCWIAGILGGLNLAQMMHAQHANLVFHGVGWGGLLIAGRAIESGRAGRAFLGGLIVACSAHFGLYVGLHAVVAGLCLLPFAPRNRAMAAALGGGALGALTLVPVAAIYTHAAVVGGATVNPAEIARESVDLAKVMLPVAGVRMHELLAHGTPTRVLDQPNPGYFAAILAAIGLWTAWRHGARRAAADPGAPPVWRGLLLAAVVAAILALGPRVMVAGHAGPPAPYALLLWLPGFAGLRGPSRWLEVVWPILGLVAALGTRWLGARAGRPYAVAALAGVALLAELPRLQWMNSRIAEPPFAYQAIEQVPGRQAVADPETGVPALMAALHHRRPLLGGYFARDTQLLHDIDDTVSAFPSETSIEALRAFDVGIVLSRQRFEAPSGVSCARYEPHVVCVLPPRESPLPPPDLVGEDVIGPVVAVRPQAWPAKLTVRCGDVAETHDLAAWRLVSRVRETELQVFLDRPCDAAVTADVPIVPLRRRAGYAFERWP